MTRRESNRLLSVAMGALTYALGHVADGRCDFARERLDEAERIIRRLTKQGLLDSATLTRVDKYLGRVRKAVAACGSKFGGLAARW